MRESELELEISTANKKSLELKKELTSLKVTLEKSYGKAKPENLPPNKDIKITKAELETAKDKFEAQLKISSTKIQSAEIYDNQKIIHDLSLAEITYVDAKKQFNLAQLEQGLLDIDRLKLCTSDREFMYQIDIIQDRYFDIINMGQVNEISTHNKTLANLAKLTFSSSLDQLSEKKLALEFVKASAEIYKYTEFSDKGDFSRRAKRDKFKEQAVTTIDQAALLLKSSLAEGLDIKSLEKQITYELQAEERLVKQIKKQKLPSINQEKDLAKIKDNVAKLTEKIAQINIDTKEISPKLAQLTATDLGASEFVIKDLMHFAKLSPELRERKAEEDEDRAAKADILATKLSNSLQQNITLLKLVADGTVTEAQLTAVGVGIELTDKVISQIPIPIITNIAKLLTKVAEEGHLVSLQVIAKSKYKVISSVSTEQIKSFATEFAQSYNYADKDQPSILNDITEESLDKIAEIAAGRITGKLGGLIKADNLRVGSIENTLLQAVTKENSLGSSYQVTNSKLAKTAQSAREGKITAEGFLSRGGVIYNGEKYLHAKKGTEKYGFRVVSKLPEGYITRTQFKLEKRAEVDVTELESGVEEKLELKIQELKGKELIAKQKIYFMLNEEVKAKLTGADNTEKMNFFIGELEQNSLARLKEKYLSTGMINLAVGRKTQLTKAGVREQELTENITSYLKVARELELEVATQASADFEDREQEVEARDVVGEEASIRDVLLDSSVLADITEDESKKGIQAKAQKLYEGLSKTLSATVSKSESEVTAKKTITLKPQTRPAKILDVQNSADLASEKIAVAQKVLTLKEDLLSYRRKLAVEYGLKAESQESFSKNDVQLLSVQMKQAEENFASNIRKVQSEIESSLVQGNKKNLKELQAAETEYIQAAKTYNIAQLSLAINNCENFKYDLTDREFTFELAALQDSYNQTINQPKLNEMLAQSEQFAKMIEFMPEAALPELVEKKISLEIVKSVEQIYQYAKQTSSAASPNILQESSLRHLQEASKLLRKELSSSTQEVAELRQRQELLIRDKKSINTQAKNFLGFSRRLNSKEEKSVQTINEQLEECVAKTTKLLAYQEKSGAMTEFKLDNFGKMEHGIVAKTDFVNLSPEFREIREEEKLKLEHKVTKLAKAFEATMKQNITLLKLVADGLVEETQLTAAGTSIEVVSEFVDQIPIPVLTNIATLLLDAAEEANSANLMNHAQKKYDIINHLTEEQIKAFATEFAESFSYTDKDQPSILTEITEPALDNIANIAVSRITGKLGGEIKTKNLSRDIVYDTLAKAVSQENKLGSSYQPTNTKLGRLKDSKGKGKLTAEGLLSRGGVIYQGEKYVEATKGAEKYGFRLVRNLPENYVTQARYKLETQGQISYAEVSENRAEELALKQGKSESDMNIAAAKITAMLRDDVKQKLMNEEGKIELESLEGKSFAEIKKEFLPEVSSSILSVFTKKEESLTKEQFKESELDKALKTYFAAKAEYQDLILSTAESLSSREVGERDSINSINEEDIRNAVNSPDVQKEANIVASKKTLKQQAKDKIGSIFAKQGKDVEQEYRDPGEVPNARDSAVEAARESSISSEFEEFSGEREVDVLTENPMLKDKADPKLAKKTGKAAAAGAAAGLGIETVVEVSGIEAVASLAESGLLDVLSTTSLDTMGIAGLAAGGAVFAASKIRDSLRGSRVDEASDITKPVLGKFTEQIANEGRNSSIGRGSGG
ncbi:MAG: hypothetical protein HOH73_04320 [Alphaproteobacteria bacterium]|nr:hypothetical protein [Alphaproteobacteria bacterium]